MGFLYYSLGNMHANDSTLFSYNEPLSTVTSRGSCAYVSGSSYKGYAQAKSCSGGKLFVCQTKPNQVKPGEKVTWETRITYPCPKTYTSYKDMCLRANIKPANYESAQVR